MKLEMTEVGAGQFQTEDFGSAGQAGNTIAKVGLLVRKTFFAARAVPKSEVWNDRSGRSWNWKIQLAYTLKNVSSNRSDCCKFEAC